MLPRYRFTLTLSARDDVAGTVKDSFWTEEQDFPYTMEQLKTISGVLIHVVQERLRQDALWGEQNHPDGTGLPELSLIAEIAKKACTEAEGRPEDDPLRQTWAKISMEEHFEAMMEKDEEALMNELIQDAAVKVAWVESILRRREKRAKSEGRTDQSDTT